MIYFKTIKKLYFFRDEIFFFKNQKIGFLYEGQQQIFNLYITNKTYLR